MKPQVLFELTNLHKPLAWMGDLKFTRVVMRGTAKKYTYKTMLKCLIWNPELFEPREMNDE